MNTIKYRPAFASLEVMKQTDADVVDFLQLEAIDDKTVLNRLFRSELPAMLSDAIDHVGAEQRRIAGVEMRNLSHNVARIDSAYEIDRVLYEIK